MDEDKDYTAKVKEFYAALNTINNIYFERQNDLQNHSLDNLYAHLEILEGLVEVFHKGFKLGDPEVEKCKQITNSFLEKICLEIKDRFNVD